MAFLKQDFHLYIIDGSLAVFVGPHRHNHANNPVLSDRQLLLAQTCTPTPTQIHFLHETGIGILIGIIFGGLLYYFNDISKVDFDEQIFFYGLLPPMIFAGGYNLKKKDFGKNFKFILIYGLAGTITSFGIVFGLTALINNLHWIIPLRSENHIEHL